MLNFVGILKRCIHNNKMLFRRCFAGENRLGIVRKKKKKKVPRVRASSHRAIITVRVQGYDVPSFKHLHAQRIVMVIRSDGQHAVVCVFDPLLFHQPILIVQFDQRVRISFMQLEPLLYGPINVCQTKLTLIILMITIMIITTTPDRDIFDNAPTLCILCTNVVKT